MVSLHQEFSEIKGIYQKYVSAPRKRLPCQPAGLPLRARPIHGRARLGKYKVECFVANIPSSRLVVIASLRSRRGNLLTRRLRRLFRSSRTSFPPTAKCTRHACSVLDRGRSLAQQTCRACTGQGEGEWHVSCRLQSKRRPNSQIVIEDAPLERLPPGRKRDTIGEG
jgi:hypothetical protein